MIHQFEVSKRVAELVKLTKEVYGLTLPPFKLSFSNRMTRCAGMYEYKGYTYHELKFSLPFMQANSLEEYDNTIIHEVSHFVDRMLHGSTIHNAQFYEVMRKLGSVKQTRYHTLRRSDKIKMVAYKCIRCGKIIEVTERRHNNIQKALKYNEYYSHIPCGKSAKLILA